MQGVTLARLLDATAVPAFGSEPSRFQDTPLKGATHIPFIARGS